MLDVASYKTFTRFGQKCTIEWLDNGRNLLLSAIGFAPALLDSIPGNRYTTLYLLALTLYLLAHTCTATCPGNPSSGYYQEPLHNLCGRLHAICLFTFCFNVVKL